MAQWLTEDEAHKCICPVMRPEVMAQFNGVPYCVASQCMAWRWAETHIGKPGEELRMSRDTYGFCGLAGFPNPRGPERRQRDEHLAALAGNVQSAARHIREEIEPSGGYTEVDASRALCDLIDSLARILREIA